MLVFQSSQAFPVYVLQVSLRECEVKLGGASQRACQLVRTLKRNRDLGSLARLPRTSQAAFLCGVAQLVSGCCSNRCSNHWRVCSNRSNHLVKSFFLYIRGIGCYGCYTPATGCYSGCYSSLRPTAQSPRQESRVHPGSPSMSQAWRNAANIGRRMGHILEVR